MWRQGLSGPSRRQTVKKAKPAPSLGSLGLIVPMLAINMQTGELAGTPEIITRGFVVDESSEALLRDATALIRDAIMDAPMEERTDVGLLRERVRSELQRVVRRKAGRRPLIVPVVMEI